jgi:sugar phosphate isomerase/epimerase
MPTGFQVLQSSYLNTHSLFLLICCIVSALSCYGNPVHPNKKLAKGFHEDWANTLKLAKALGIETIVTFSGGPGGSPTDEVPN